MKTLKHYQSEPDAVIDSLHLKDMGIAFSIVKNDGGPYPSLSNIHGYSILVNDDDYENALNGLVKNMNNTDMPDKATLPTEKTVSVKAENRWLFYAGAVIGIIIGLVAYWVHMNIGFHFSGYPKTIYKDGWAVSMIQDRNKDKKDDYWQKWDNDGNIRCKGDNNYDGKVDYWWKEKKHDIVVEKKDCNFNGIADETTVFKNFIIRCRYFHPDNPATLVKFQQYSPSGMLQTEYVDTDSIAGMNVKRIFDRFGTVISEEKIADTTIVQLER